MSGISRRSFFKIALGAGLTIAIGVGRAQKKNKKNRPEAYQFNSWLRVGSDGVITLALARAEMGQRILTTSAMLVADELGADWSKIKVEWASIDPRLGKLQAVSTGYSRSTEMSWRLLRNAAAITREMLVAAAAQQWDVSPSTCQAEGGWIVHARSGRRLEFAALATAASLLPVPAKVVLKPASMFSVIGKSMLDLDSLAKATGAAQFGLDVRVPGMLVAVIERAPAAGCQLLRCDDKAALKVPGVRQVIQMVRSGNGYPTGTAGGVAVVAEDTWSALQGRDKLKPVWSPSTSNLSTLELMGDLQQRAQKEEGEVLLHVGEPLRELAKATRTLDAEFETPFLAHATMEPMNCTADVRSDACDIWVPTQHAQGVHSLVTSLTGLPPSAVRVHPTYLGGGFGRRLYHDFVAEAVELSRAASAPVKVMFTRSDDMKNDFFHPATCQRLRAGLDDRGEPTSLVYQVAGPTRNETFLCAHLANDFRYSIPHRHFFVSASHATLPVGAWRSVAFFHRNFAVESFLDEIAALGGQDPLALRLKLLQQKQGGLAAVLALAADKAGWSQHAGHKNLFQGMALNEHRGAFIATIAEISLQSAGALKLERLVCAVDCGLAVHPQSVRAQIEGGVIFGLSAALWGEITVAGGSVVQSNFDDYRIARMRDVPKIDIYFVPGGKDPIGVGELAVPTVAPAIANAIFAATGNRLRKLPLRTLG